MHPPSRILAASLNRMATSSPRSRHRTTPLSVARQGGTNSGVTPNASQKMRRVLLFRLDLSRAFEARVAKETARPAADSTAAFSIGAVTVGFPRNARIAASSALLQVNFPTLLPLGVQRPLGIVDV